MRSGHRKFLIPAIGLIALVLAFALPAGAQASSAGRAVARQGSAKLDHHELSSATCTQFILHAHYTNPKAVPYGSDGLLYWSNVPSAVSNVFCQEQVSPGSSNVVIYDLNYINNACLAYDSETGEVYIHDSCTGTSYEQWKFLDAGSSANPYLLENGWKVNGVNYCLEYNLNGNPSGLGGCTPENHYAVLDYSTSF